MKQASVEEVREYLRLAKSALARNRLAVVDRIKNREALLDLGWNRKNQEDLIFGLAEKDYSKGPERDRDRDGEIWVFGPKREGKQFYVKVKLVGVSPVVHLKCISFHLAEDPLALPYSEEE